MKGDCLRRNCLTVPGDGAACKNTPTCAPARAWGRRVGRAIAAGLFFVVSSLPALDLPNPAQVFGVDASGVNPAQLGLPGQPTFTYRVLGLNVAADNNFFNINRLVRISTNAKGFADSTARGFLDSLPANGFRVNSDVQADLLSLAVGHVAFTAGAHALVGASVPKSVADLEFDGYRSNRSYSVSKLGGNALAYADAALSYGTRLPDGFYAGIGLRYLRGFAVAASNVSGRPGGPKLVDSVITADYHSAFDPLGGYGVGLDCGVTYCRPHLFGRQDQWQFGLALLNLNSGITWTNGVNSGSLRIFNKDSAQTTGNDATPFRTALPAYVNLGANCIPWYGVALGLGVAEATMSTPTSSTVPRVALSAEYRQLDWLRLSLEAATGGFEGPTLGAGLELKASWIGFRVRVTNAAGLADDARGASVELAITCSSRPPAPVTTLSF